MLRRIGQWFLARRLPGGPNQWSPDWLASAGVDPRSPAVVVPDQLAAALRCASLLSDSLAAVPPSVFEPLPTGGQDRVTASDAARAIRRTAYSDWETLLLQCALHGNGFARILRNDRNGPHALSAIPCRLVTVALDTEGRVWYEIVEDEQTGTAAEIISARDMVHVKYRCLDSALIGVGPLKAAAASISGAVQSFQLRESLHRNLSQAGLAFSTDMELNADQMQQLREAVDKQTKGLRAGGSIVLSHGLKMDRGGGGAIKATDSELLESLRFSVEEVCRIFGVPPSMVGMAQESSYSTAAEERRSFVNSTLRPWARRIADELGRKLLAEEERSRGLTVAYDFSAELLGEGNERAEALSKLVNSGVYSPNEARNLLGLADVPGGEELRAPVNVYPLSAWSGYGPPEPAPDETERAVFIRAANIAVERAFDEEPAPGDTEEATDEPQEAAGAHDED